MPPAAQDLAGLFINVERLFGSLSFQRMSFSEKGVYLVMLFQQWRETGRNLPDDPHQVADLIAVTADQSAEVAAAWEVVRRKFVTSDHTPGRIWNVQVEDTRKRQRANQRKRAEAGKQGGKASAGKRWGTKDLSGKQSLTTVQQSLTTVTPPLSNAQRPLSNKRREEESREEERERKAPPSLSPAAPSDPTRDPFLDPVITERAGRFLERYQALYQHHRHGARYALKPTRDYAAAVTLCQTWTDDERLERIAVIFLTTDHKFAEEGSRTVPQFLALASWCDGKLAEWEKEQAAKAV